MIPAVGIGDLLILKMAIMSRTIYINELKISLSMIKQYRLDYTTYIKFLEYFLPKIFPDIVISYDTKYVSQPPVYNQYSITKTYMYDTYKFDYIPSPNRYKNYLIFHTKVRIDKNQTGALIYNPMLKQFFETFKTNRTVIILGERTVEQNCETIAHNIVSIYNMMMLMKNNNDLIDLTYNELYSGNTPENFEKDIHFMNSAECNIGFGIGGGLTLCMAFSKNNLFYIGGIGHPILDCYIKTGSIYRDLPSFFQKIIELYGVS